MTIRAATPADTPELLRMARSFLEATPYGRLFKATPDSLEALVGLLFSFGDQATILVAEDAGFVYGMLAIVASPHPFNGKQYADEVVWWVDPTARGAGLAGPKLLRCAEDWARARNCYMVKMVAPFGSTVGGFYERLGYTPIETAYAKTLGGE